MEYYTGYRNAQKYPLAYNESFNRILPIIYTLLSRFMGQLYQGQDIVSAAPRHGAKIESAKKVEGLLNYQLENLNNIDKQGGSYITMLNWFFNAITFDKGILKCYWRKEDRIGPRRLDIPVPSFDRNMNFQGYDIVAKIDQVMQTTYNGPYCEVLHNKLCVPHPYYRDVQSMPAFFIVYQRSLDYLHMKAKKQEYSNLDELGWSSSSGSQGHAGHYEQDSFEQWAKGVEIEGVEWENDTSRDSLKTDNVDVVEAYTKMILKNEPYEVGSGYVIKGPEEEVIVHLGNYKALLSIQRNTYGIRPIFDIGAYMHPEMYWDLGLVRLTKGIQEQINNLGNLRMQDAFLKVNQMIRVNPDSDLDPDQLTWRPFGIIPAEKDEVEPISIIDTNSNIFVEQETFYEKTIQDITGMYPYNMGQNPQRQERVGVVHSIQSMGEARAKLMLMSIDYLGIRPLLNYMMLLNTFHLPSGYEYRAPDLSQSPTQYRFERIFGPDIHPNYDFTARYTGIEPALGKQFRAQNMIQMAQMWAQSPWINQYQLIKTIFELMDIREAETIIKDPRQFAIEMQQQVQQAMIAEQQKIMSETRGKTILESAKSDRDIRLEDQKFQHELVLEGISLGVEQEANEIKRSQRNSGPVRKQ